MFNGENMKRKTIVNRGYYHVYLLDGLFFVLISGKPFAIGFETLQGVKEYLYYQGLIDSKTANI